MEIPSLTLRCGYVGYGSYMRFPRRPFKRPSPETCWANFGLVRAPGDEFPRAWLLLYVAWVDASVAQVAVTPLISSDCFLALLRRSERRFMLIPLFDLGPHDMKMLYVT